jgi:RNA 2',3'-cyclic 3'-phosphodiesterase
VSGQGPRDDLRLFVAAELPTETLRAVEAWQHEAFAGHGEVRLNHALHLTLAFLGDVARERVDDLVAVLAAVRFEPCQLAVAEVLFLPQKGPKRIVALALADRDGRLAQRQAEVSAALAATGVYIPPKRPWLPHVTVARFRRAGHPFSLQNVNIPAFSSVRTVLYSSFLERAGAVHTPLADFPAS